MSTQFQEFSFEEMRSSCKVLLLGAAEAIRQCIVKSGHKDLTAGRIATLSVPWLRCLCQLLDIQPDDLDLIASEVRASKEWQQLERDGYRPHDRWMNLT